MFYRIFAGFMTVAMLGAGTVGTENYEYDQLNRLTKVIYEDGSYVTYEYDANGNITHTEVYDAGDKESHGESGTGESGTDDPGTEDPGTGGSGSDDPGIDAPDIYDPGSDQPAEDAPTQQDPAEDEPKSILGIIIDAVVKVVNTVVNWMKSLFQRR